ncbi:MAG: response regulator [Thaumarchaeota archaeon]|nr:response regulator [Nitrososphaerota archaeon]MBI3641170.1 response regulator [Nitrososphaerota archaeon]
MARIVIADDSDAIRMVLRDILDIGHHELVAEATNGFEAVEKFNETKPDLLLLDMAMPKKDGMSALKEIMSSNPDAKIIMITASDNLNTMTACINAGALAYLLKPFNFEDVLKNITKILDGTKN